MIKKASRIRHNDEIGLKGGRGTLEIVNFIETAESCGTGRLFAISRIPPGASIGKHTHAGDFEIYYMLKGVAHVEDDGVPGVLEPGDCMVCYDGKSHSIENRGEETVEYVALILYTPGQERARA